MNCIQTAQQTDLFEARGDGGLNQGWSPSRKRKEKNDARLAVITCLYRVLVVFLQRTIGWKPLGWLAGPVVFILRIIVPQAVPLPSSSLLSRF